MNAVMPLSSEDPTTMKTPALSIPGTVVVKDAGAKGRGCFATAPIKKGQLIERCPVIVVPVTERELIDKTKLYHYYYAWTPEDEGMAISLGYGSIYNHSFAPNAIFDRVFDGGYIDYVAIKDIDAGAEITVNYNGDPDDQDPLPYFDVHD